MQGCLKHHAYAVQLCFSAWRARYKRKTQLKDSWNEPSPLSISKYITIQVFLSTIATIVPDKSQFFWIIFWDARKKFRGGRRQRLNDSVKNSLLRNVSAIPPREIDDLPDLERNRPKKKDAGGRGRQKLPAIKLHG